MTAEVGPAHQRARQQAANLLSSSEMEELKRITDWAKETTDGSLSDFDITPDPKVWDLVCSERGLCSTKLCGHNSDFSKIGQTCFYQRARSRILSADVLVLNHSLFFSLLGFPLVQYTSPFASINTNSLSSIDLILSISHHDFCLSI